MRRLVMRSIDRGPLAVTVLALLLLLAWDAGSGDLWLARLAGGTSGFPWRENYWLTEVLHRGGKALGWMVWLALLLMVRWPRGVLRRLTVSERWQLVLSALVGVAAVNLLKHGSQTSCPWDLVEFGGRAARVSHWAWTVRDGGPGHCFPAGHASAGFAFAGGWFVLRQRAPRVAAAWLACALLTGLLLGLGQQWRGAHFLSHTLWSAWVCWLAGWGFDRAWHVGAWTRPGRRVDTKLNAS